jgi:hypothetical protein
VEERLRRLEQVLNYEEEILCATIITDTAVDLTSNTAIAVGTWLIPWSELRHLLPPERWALWAVGWAQCSGAFDIGIGYQKNDTSLVLLASWHQPTAAAWTKGRVGPVAARGPLAPAAMPQNEEIPAYALLASTPSGTKLSLKSWSFWLRMTPRHV